MLTPKEALIHLANGGKLAFNATKYSGYIVLDESGSIVDRKGRAVSISFLKGAEIYEEPKPKITLWRRPWYVTERGGWSSTNWFEDKNKFLSYYDGVDCRGEWESMEVDAE